MLWPIHDTSQITPENFVRFWDQMYSADDEEFYRENIGHGLSRQFFLASNSLHDRAGVWASSGSAKTREKFDCLRVVCASHPPSLISRSEDDYITTSRCKFAFGG